ncbi:MAG: MmcQ/YjbR family DNA-binding protein [bacterium]|jgi:predicted DNA-binding protein (MmcQ/YjbR family)|nr:MmcQ/YjbR family DNA-binding protein [bacterium]
MPRSTLGRSALRQRLAAFPLATEEEPFGPGVWVYKVCGRVFALLTQEGEPPRLSLKCDPARALELRAAFATVTPGYHLNKEHWNTLALDGSLPPALVEDLVDHSFQRVAAGLRRAERQALAIHGSTT